METININMTPNCHDVETIHASQNDTSLRKWGIRPYDYEGNDVTNQQDNATLVDIKGKTLKWNQLVSSASGWVSNNGTLSQSGNTYTYTVTALGDYDYQNRMQRAFPFVIPKGHKMFLSCEFYYPRNTPIFIYMIRAGASGTNRSIGGTTVANQWTRISGIQFDTSTEFGYYQLALATIASNGYSVGDSVQVRNPMAIDLTMLFGEGNEPSTVDEFKSLFPLDYYDFNIGSLIPFMGNGIKTTGKNLVSLALSPASQQRVAGVTIQSQTNEEFTITSTGSGTYANLGLYYNLKKGTYTVKFQAEASDSFAPIMTVYGYNGGTGQVVSNAIPRNTARTFTLTEDKMVEFRCFATTTSAVRTVRFYDFQVEFGSTATAYEPYTTSVINLPISTYFPTGMDGVGSEYDELTNTKAYHRMARVDLGTLNWSYNANYGFISTSLSGVIKGEETYSAIGDIACAKYTTNAYSAVTGGQTDKCIAVSPTQYGYVVVSDSVYTDAQTFKTSLSGVYLVYPLANPTETDISPELDLTFNIDKGGTEELLPSGLLNGSVDLGSLTWTYQSGNTRFQATMPTDAKMPSGNNVPINGFCESYPNVASSSVSTTDKSLGVTSSGYLLIRDDSFNGDATAFTNSLQGVYLWYEKSDSTPTTTPLNATIKYPAETKDVYFTYQVSDFLSTVFKFYLVTKGIQIPCELEDDTLIVDCTSEISNEPGFFDCKIKAENDLGQIFSNKFQLHIERSPQ